MTQNQSGKQFFEWVNSSDGLPEKDGKYSCILESGFNCFMWFTKDSPIKWFYLDMNNAGKSSNCVTKVTDVVKWLDESPAQPYTGKPD